MNYSKMSRLTPKQHFDQRYTKLIRFDDIRQQELLEIFQYSLIYFIIAFPIGILISKLFPTVDEDKSTWQLYFEIILQLLVDIFMVYYILKLVKLVPFMFYYQDSKYIPHLTNAFSGGIIISIAFMTVQSELGDKIKEIS